MATCPKCGVAVKWNNCFDEFICGVKSARQIEVAHEGNGEQLIIHECACHQVLGVTDPVTGDCWSPPEFINIDWLSDEHGV